MATRPIASARRRDRRPVLAIPTVLVALALLAAAALSARSGQEESDESGEVAAVPAGAQSSSQVHNHPGRPTHIHDGSCDRLGEVAYPLNPIGAGVMTGAAMDDVPAMAIGDAVGAPTALPVEIGQIMLDATIAEIVAAPRAVNVQISETEYGTYIACGDVGGTLNGETLAFGLHELDGSGFSGIAVLQGTDDGTLVTLYLGQGLTGAGSAATPTADVGTPAAGA